MATSMFPMEDPEYTALPPGDQWGQWTHHAGQDGKQREEKPAKENTAPTSHTPLPGHRLQQGESEMWQ